MAKRRGSSYSSTAEKILFQPWFLPPKVAFAIHAIVPRDYWNKMRNFFDDYGCLICGNEFEYHSNGMCKNCYDKTRKKLAQSVKRRLKLGTKLPLALVLFRQEKLANKLLRRYGARPRRVRSRRSEIPGQTNPVYDALRSLPR
jgi:hypothetical protein